jgi:DNA-binding MarR family transcriptional regulator
MPGHLLRRCQQNAVEIFAQEVGEDGLTPRQFALLLTVHQRPGLMQTELVRLTGIDRSTLAEMTRRLIGRGLLVRRRTAHDQRANELFLSADGEAALRTALPGVIRAQERILAPLEGARRGLFLECLDAVAGPSPEGGEEDGSD